MCISCGRDVLLDAKYAEDDLFETKFAEHLAKWSSTLPTPTYAREQRSAFAGSAPIDDEDEAGDEDLGGLGWGDEDLGGLDWVDEQRAGIDGLSPEPIARGGITGRSSGAQLQNRSVELQVLGEFFSKEALARRPNTALWLVDRDSRRNQPRLEQWASLHRSLRALDTQQEVIDSMYATDSKGRTRSTQLAAMQFRGNDELRRQVFIKERAEYLAGVLRRRLKSLDAGAKVLFIVNSHIVEFLIRHWFSPPDDARLAELNEMPEGLSKWQPSDVMAMYIEKQTCCQDILDLFWKFQQAGSFASSEVSVALLSLAEFSDSDLTDTFKNELNLARGAELLRRYQSFGPAYASENVEAAVQRLRRCAPALDSPYLRYLL